MAGWFLAHIGPQMASACGLLHWSSVAGATWLTKHASGGFFQGAITLVLMADCNCECGLRCSGMWLINHHDVHAMHIQCALFLFGCECLMGDAPWGAVQRFLFLGMAGGTNKTRRLSCMYGVHA